VITLYARDGNDDAGKLSYNLVKISKGVAIYHEAELAHNWYEVVSGIVRTCRFMADGHRQLTGFFYADDIFGVDGRMYRESAEAVTCVILRRYSTKGLDDAAPEGGAGRDKVLERALESARECIFLFGHRTAGNRLAAFLIALSNRASASMNIRLPMTRSDIADYLNLTMHTVSRTMSDLTRKHIIALDGPQNVRILDMDGLRVLAGEDVGDAMPAASRLASATPWERSLQETM
jgi:CRP/FNR family nitrogen fixation transcriptional regulator